MGKGRKKSLFPEASEAARKKYVDGVTVKYKQLMDRVLSGEGTQADAIKAKCYDCCAFEDIVGNVHECKAYTCPLWVFRPT